MICISDLHLADGSAADDFCADDALVKFLRARHGERIILLGDTVELLQAKLPEIERAHPAVCQAIEDYVTWIVRGNHDDVDTLFGKPTLAHLRLGSTYFCHGNEFDPWNSKPLKWVGATATRVAGWMERYIDRDIDTWLVEQGQKVFGRGRHGDTEHYRQAAIALVNQGRGKGVFPLRKVERVVMGHTHKWAVMPPYLNCGHWTGVMARHSQEFIRVEL